MRFNHPNPVLTFASIWLAGNDLRHVGMLTKSLMVQLTRNRKT